MKTHTICRGFEFGIRLKVSLFFCILISTSGCVSNAPPTPDKTKSIRDSYNGFVLVDKINSKLASKFSGRLHYLVVNNAYNFNSRFISSVPKNPGWSIYFFIAENQGNEPVKVSEAAQITIHENLPSGDQRGFFLISCEENFLVVHIESTIPEYSTEKLARILSDKEPLRLEK